MRLQQAASRKSNSKAFAFSSQPNRNRLSENTWTLSFLWETDGTEECQRTSVTKALSWNSVFFFFLETTSSTESRFCMLFGLFAGLNCGQVFGPHDEILPYIKWNLALLQICCLDLNDFMRIPEYNFGYRWFYIVLSPDFANSSRDFQPWTSYIQHKIKSILSAKFF